MAEGHDPFGFDDDEAPRGERLQKFLAASGVASRRSTEAFIRQGRVTVNNEPAHVGQRVAPEDVVRFDGVIVGPQAPRYVILNKPAGVVTTAEDTHGRPTVVELVESDVRLYPVGRLDQETTGLLLLTNDGELAHRMMHPSFGVDKTYAVLARGKVTPAVARRLAEGVELDDGMTSEATAKVIQAGQQQSLVELTIHEGRNRQVRRMFDAVGHRVIELSRVRYGPLGLGDLKLGASRDLTAQEVRRLHKVAGMSRPRRRD